MKKEMKFVGVAMLISGVILVVSANQPSVYPEYAVGIFLITYGLMHLFNANRSK